MTVDRIGTHWYVWRGSAPVSRPFATRGEAEAELARREENERRLEEFER